MSRRWPATAAALLLAGATTALANPAAPAPDPRLREVAYNAGTVVTMPLKRGMVGHIVLAPDEAITEVAAGLGGDCAKPESAWCISAQPGGRHLFVKAKSNATAPNNLAVVTSQRSHAFKLEVLASQDTRPPVYRLQVLPPAPPPLPAPVRVLAAEPMPPAPPPQPKPHELVALRLQAHPPVLNSAYSLAEGAHAKDIVPTLVYDDGRFTYLRLPGHRDVPAVFQVLADGSEALVNTRMEDDLLVVDRVCRQLVLRAGAAVVGVWNDAFDVEGVAAERGTSVDGVVRGVRGVRARD